MSGTHARGGDGFGGDRRRVPRNRRPARRRLKRRRGRSRTTQPKKFNHDIVCASSTEAVRKRGYFLITVVRERRGRIADRGGRGARSIEPIGRKVHTGGWVLRLDDSREVRGDSASARTRERGRPRRDARVRDARTFLCRRKQCGWSARSTMFLRFFPTNLKSFSNTCWISDSSRGRIVGGDATRGRTPRSGRGAAGEAKTRGGAETRGLRATAARERGGRSRARAPSRVTSANDAAAAAAPGQPPLTQD